MKKIAILLACIVLFLTGCGSKSELAEATGANSKQDIAITEILESVGITYGLVNEANHNKPTIEIDKNLKVYNVIDKDGINYFLVLSEELEVVAILDKDSNVLYGSLA